MNQSAVALQFARLLNEARIRLQTDVDACAECKDGVLTLYGPGGVPSKETCLDCLGDREFLARCEQVCGPVVIDSVMAMRLALGDASIPIVELPSSAPVVAAEGCFSAALGSPRSPKFTCLNHNYHGDTPCRECK